MNTTTDRLYELSPLQKAALAIKELRAKLAAVEAASTEAIAILGMACRFPQAPSLEQYWQLLVNQQDAIREVPLERWDLARFFDPNPHAPGKINTRYGGFIDDVAGFDAAFFGVAPAEAERMDPQQRLVLEVAWHALEDAGLAPTTLRGSNTGVFVGITQMDYGVMQLGGPVEEIQAYTGTGNGVCFIAGRLAYVFGLHGPTFALDTACSSSMVATHQACQALRNHECDLAIVAGTQLNLTPPMQIFLSKTQSFAPDGRCRTFDEAANGFVLGEGLGVIILSRLSDAHTRHLPIRALIRASGVNHDGPASGLTVPSEFAQESLLRTVYQRARITPDAVDYIEAHGTATQLGDPIEIGALKSVFGQRPGAPPLLLGTVKTNFGHLNAAAGIAGLIKVVLMLEHEQVAPNLHFQQPSSRIAWDGFSVKIPTTCLPWPRRATPRIAGVSSFGLSGTNTHTVLQEAPLTNPQPLTTTADRPCHLLALSARSEDALRQLARAYIACPAMATDAHIADLCFSANTGRNHFAQRLAYHGATTDALRHQLESFLAADPAHTSASVPKGGIKRSILLFTATLTPSWIRTLVVTQPTFADIWARCQAAYQQIHGGQLDLDTATPSTILAGQIAWAELWRSWGVHPTALAGVGVGRLSALYHAHALTMDQAFQALAGYCVDLNTPELTLYHGTDGTRWLNAPLPGYQFSAHSAEVVPQAVSALISAGYPQVIGIGTLDQGCDVIGAPQPDAEIWPTLLSGLATLYKRGLNVDWLSFDAHYPRQRVRLPGYPFQHQRYWLSTALANTQPRPANIPAIHQEMTTTSWPQQLAHQLDTAVVAINEVVAQQLAVLRTSGIMTIKAVEPQLSVTSSATSVITLGDWQLLRLAATDEAQLERLGEALVAQPAAIPPLNDGPCRAMLVHRGDADAKQALGTTWTQRDQRRVLSATVRPGRSVVFMFPGVGDHYLRMAWGLYQHEPVFRARVDSCCALLHDLAGINLRDILYPATAIAPVPPPTAQKLDFRAMLGRAPAAAHPDEIRLNQTRHSQPLVFIIEYALAELWLSRGIVPQALIGYSIGEYAAACLAGVITVNDALRLILQRAQLIEQLPHGVMLAIPLPEARLRPLLHAELSLAIVSTPNQCVVGGPETAIAALEAQLRRDEIVSRRLPGTHAFHTHMLAPLHEPLRQLVSGFQLHTPRIPYLSNLTGTWMSATAACDPDYWARHTWQTVRFAEALEQVLDSEGRIFLEVGPGQSLGSFVLQHPAATRLHDKFIFPSLRNRYEQQADEAFFLTTLGKLWLAAGPT